MGGRVKLYTDEHILRALVTGLRRRGVEVVTYQEAGMLSVADETHLQLATRQRRTALTQDEDFLRLHASGFPDQGIIYSHRQTPIGQVIRKTMLRAAPGLPNTLAD